MLPSPGALPHLPTSLDTAGRFFCSRIDGAKTLATVQVRRFYRCFYLLVGIKNLISNKRGIADKMESVAAGEAIMTNERRQSPALC